MKTIKDKIVEILYKAIDNAFAFENYDGPKSEQDLTKSNEYFADEILSLITEHQKQEAKERYDEAKQSIFKPEDEVPSILYYRGSYVIDALKIASGYKEEE